MPEVAITRGTDITFHEMADGELGAWLNTVQPYEGVIALDFEASGRHPDGNWATDAAKCEPEARVSIASMAWQEWVDDVCAACSGADGAETGVPVPGVHSEGCVGDGRAERLELVSCAIPFDQGMVGGKLGRLIKTVTKKTPALGWETIAHTDACRPGHCACAPHNFGVSGWQDLMAFWQSNKVTSIDYFNAKYDLWIALAGMRDGADADCRPSCVGWQHADDCLNRGLDLSAKLGRDVMIFEAIRDPAEKASLDNVARKFFGESKDKGMDEGLKANGVGLGKRYDLVDWRIAGKYAAKDAELTLRAQLHEDEMADAGEIDSRDFPIIKREHRKILTLWNMERAGVPFNVELCREQATKMHAEIDRLNKVLPWMR